MMTIKVIYGQYKYKHVREFATWFEMLCWIDNLAFIISASMLFNIIIKANIWKFAMNWWKIDKPESKVSSSL